METSDKDRINFISTIIPVYNDPIGIKVTLDSLIKQDYPRDRFELLVIDNNSSDNTREIVSEYVKKYAGKVFLLVEGKIQSSYAARNRGIRAARGEHLAFLDSDMWADRNWFKIIAKSFEDPKIGYVGFNIRIHPSGKSLVGLYNALTGFPIGTYMKESHFAGAGCIAVRRSAFKKIGLFDYRMISGGDAEFGDRCWRGNVGQSFNDDYLLHHPARESFRSLMKKEFRVGRGQRQLADRYPKRFGNNRSALGSINLFLPPNPVELARKIRKSKLRKVSLRDFLVYYLIGLSSKFSRNLGHSYEGFSQR
ncbi:MAG: glycosyltransferase [Parcubacteria group bacterium]